MDWIQTITEAYESPFWSSTIQNRPNDGSERSSFYHPSSSSIEQHQMGGCEQHGINQNVPYGLDAPRLPYLFPQYYNFNASGYISGLADCPTSMSLLPPSSRSNDPTVQNGPIAQNRNYHQPQFSSHQMNCVVRGDRQRTSRSSPPRPSLVDQTGRRFIPNHL